MTVRLLTAREVAEVVGLSTETVLRWVRRGELPALRLPGGAVRFRQGDLATWLEERATPERGSVEQPRRTPPTGERTLAHVEQPLKNEE